MSYVESVLAELLDGAGVHAISDQYTNSHTIFPFRSFPAHPRGAGSEGVPAPAGGQAHRGARGQRPPVSPAIGGRKDLNHFSPRHVRGEKFHSRSEVSPPKAAAPERSVAPSFRRPTGV